MYGSGPSTHGGGGLITGVAGGGVAGVGSLAYTGFSSFTVALIAAVLVVCGILLFRLAVVRKPVAERDGAAEVSRQT
ncbi:uncharacterized membrane protein YgaE (UPF0421/DUF939 family) [Psychromicrobium silvestre]|uniref:Uncharacterized membrane protein YgaE (UPF0421/DUF939 family) n=1 Tax=Psychromicrobium silvestre TaxID=1645614 RepID=A0A7Y9S951_9MICC|nr:hypothetical protein [Psychromicrobium silvestre]NYE96651.1 uncharacterized membrane protein YgaE (UPF0421/DUF939 family) [Psychromicrobium silvestre]